jgi:hypothetical protein
MDNDRYLFRGKRNDNGEWVNGCYYHSMKSIDGRTLVDTYLIRDDCYQDYEVAAVPHRHVMSVMT